MELVECKYRVVMVGVHSYRLCSPKASVVDYILHGIGECLFKGSINESK